MAVPPHAKYAIIGAGIHGLSTAYHLAVKLKETGRGSGKDILVVDKSAVAAGASGIACGVIRLGLGDDRGLARSGFRILVISPARLARWSNVFQSAYARTHTKT